MHNSQERGISRRTQELIERLLVEKFSLVEIVKITGLSEQFLQDYIQERFKLLA